MITLKYRDEKDRAYGLGGMIVSLFMAENDHFIDSVSLDASKDKGISFTPDFYYAANQKLSAKTVWDEEYTEFQLMVAMVVANVMSRAMVRNNEEVNREMSDLLLKRLTEEGENCCALGDDEVRELYYDSFSFFHSVFAHHNVVPLMKEFVKELMKERTLKSDRINIMFRSLARR